MKIVSNLICLNFCYPLRISGMIHNIPGCVAIFLLVRVPDVIIEKLINKLGAYHGPGNVMLDGMLNHIIQFHTGGSDDGD